MNELRIIYFRYGNNFNLQRTTSWVYYHTYTHTRAHIYFPISSDCIFIINIIQLCCSATTCRSTVSHITNYCKTRRAREDEFLKMRTYCYIVWMRRSVNPHHIRCVKIEYNVWHDLMNVVCRLIHILAVNQHASLICFSIWNSTARASSQLSNYISSKNDTIYEICKDNL